MNYPNNKNIHARDYLGILMRRKWIALTFFLITVTVVTIATYLQKPVYRAVSTVIVEVESPDVLSVKDVIKLGESNYFAYRDYIETQQEIIRSRRTCHRVIKNLGLGSKKEFREAKDPIEALLKKVKVELVRDTRILRISVDDTDPREASDIANEFAKVYANANIALKIRMSTDAETWLKAEVDKQKKKVRDAEFKLQVYKEKNDIVSIENKEGILNDGLGKLNASYLDAQKNRIKSETTYTSLVDTQGNLKLENLPAISTDNEILQQLKKDYLKQESILVEYRKVYKDKHPKMIALLGGINYIKARLKSEIETQYNYAKEEESKFKKALEDKKIELFALDKRTIEYNALNRELETNERILEIVLNRLKETSMSSNVQTNNVRVQDLAEYPKKPIRPKKILNLILSFVIGIVGGLGLAFFREYMDVTLKDPSEIVALLQLPILGSVPRIRIDGRNVKKWIDVDHIVEKDSHSLASEAYRSIRTNLLFSLTQQGSLKSIVITSSVPREGKTITAVNLAVMIANSGERVLLVDADMRRPRVHTVFNLDNESGLSDFLSGRAELSAISRPSGVDNLFIVTSGKASQRHTELISSGNMKLFIEKASMQFSRIIFDTPPIGLLTDAAILSSACNGTILIAEANRTTRDILNYSKELLQKVNANIIGVILNNVLLTKSSYCYPQYYYGKYYKQVDTK